MINKMPTYYLIVLICLIGISYFSSQPFSEQDLRPQIKQHQKILKEIKKMPEIEFHYGGHPIDSRRPADFIQFWIRKGAHVFSFGILGLTFTAILAGKGLKGYKRLLLASLLVILAASLDELHQTFVPGRTGQAIDATLDLAGFLSLSLIVWLIKQTTSFVRHKAHRNSTAS